MTRRRVIRVLAGGAMALALAAEVQAKAVIVGGTTPIRWVIYYGNPDAAPPLTVRPFVDAAAVLPTSQDLRDPGPLRARAPQFLGVTQVHDYPNVFAITGESHSMTYHEWPVARICDTSKVEQCLAALAVASLVWLDVDDLSSVCSGFTSAPLPAPLTPAPATDCIDSSVFARMTDSGGNAVGWLVGTTKALRPTAIAAQQYYLMTFGTEGCAARLPMVVIHNSSFFGGAISLNNWPTLKTTAAYRAITQRNPQGHRWQHPGGQDALLERDVFPVGPSSGRRPCAAHDAGGESGAHG